MKQQPITRKKNDSLTSRPPGLTFGIDKNLAEELGFIKKQEDSRLKRYQSRNKLNRVKTEDCIAEDDSDLSKQKHQIGKSLFATNKGQNPIGSQRDLKRNSDGIALTLKRGYINRCQRI